MSCSLGSYFAAILLLVVCKSSAEMGLALEMLSKCTK